MEPTTAENTANANIPIPPEPRIVSTPGTCGGTPAHRGALPDRMNQMACDQPGARR
jgi:hypothetical protein